MTTAEAVPVKVTGAPRGRLHSASALDNSSNSLVKARQYRNTIKYLYRPLTVHNRYSIHRVILLLLLSTIITYEPPYLFDEFMVFKKIFYSLQFWADKTRYFFVNPFRRNNFPSFFFFFDSRALTTTPYNVGHCSSRSSYVPARNVEHVSGRLQTFGFF